MPQNAWAQETRLRMAFPNILIPRDDIAMTLSPFQDSQTRLCKLQVFRNSAEYQIIR
jgi:hypothetical protein